MQTLTVAAKSNPTAIAGAIASVIRTDGKVEIQAVGAGAVNQSVKAIAIARGYLAPSGRELICVPAFITIMMDGIEKNAISLVVKPRD